MLAAALALFVAVALVRILAVAASPTSQVSPAPRTVLRTDPTRGAAIVALLRDGGVESGSFRHHAVASRRAPRFLASRAWLADHHLRAGRHAQALDQIDVLLRLSPLARRELLPLMVEWSADRAFATALVDRLGTDPEWRAGMLGALAANAEHPAASAVLAQLRARGDMSQVEVARWLEVLMRQGQWGRAYSHWVATLDRSPTDPLPMLHDGGFEAPVADPPSGFGWRTGRAAGTYTEFGPADGARGRAAHLVFLGRPVDAANLAQPLVLPPGGYQLEMRVRAQSLRSSQGLEWTLSCHRSPRPFATSDALSGDFDWRRFVFAFEVPSEACDGQWLRLDNPAPGGSAGIVTGDLWIDDLVVTRVDRPAESITAPSAPD